MSIAQIQIANMDTDVYTSTNASAITTMVFCNTTVAAATITVYIIPNGGASGDDTTIIKDLSIAAKDTYVFDTSKFILDNLDRNMIVSNFVATNNCSSPSSVSNSTASHE